MPILGDEERPVVNRHGHCNVPHNDNFTARTSSKSPDCRCAPLQDGHRPTACRCTVTRELLSLPGMNSVRRPGLSELTRPKLYEESATRRTETFSASGFLADYWSSRAPEADAHSTQHRSAIAKVAWFSRIAQSVTRFNRAGSSVLLPVEVRVLFSKPIHRPSWRGSADRAAPAFQRCVE